MVFVQTRFLVKPKLTLCSLWDNLWISNDKSTFSKIKTFDNNKLSTGKQNSRIEQATYELSLSY